jgi:hypothetical protein
VLRLPRPPIEGQNATIQLRDLFAAMQLILFGTDPDDYGFYWGRAKALRRRR